MGSGKRGLLAAAVTVVCAVCALAVPATAYASVPVGTVSGASAGSADAPEPPKSPAPPTPAPDKDLEKVRAKLDALYHDAAVATDAYNAAEERSEKQARTIARLERRIEDGRRRLALLKNQAGASAREQYRTGMLPPAAQFLLSDDPQKVFDGAGSVLNGQRAATNLIAETTRTQDELRELTDDAAAEGHRLDADRKAKAAAKKRITAQIDTARALEFRLERKERDRLAELERKAAREAQTRWLDTGALKKPGTPGKTGLTGSAQGREAVRFATEQLGKPYVWGAEGPDSFDCSGLTSQAWASAGHPVPRTSQEQWRQLKHVAVADMRPGDLIIYFADASHVAMYVGDGMIIHAPRPGRTVTVAGAGTMPILGVVRPDA
ncbi:C40 family peptidase [Streptomyces sp. J2-1]|uniref:C40 family peptidase n=1 Tax=Streptomyces corallincola TaxID=2851888 RepID=UPI001C389D60|nr:NlpC/P60 family protein [Streptomyces corallincola]MBV2356851.1 C40 family peptidase [Streptomyces corallincola]